MYDVTILLFVIGSVEDGYYVKNVAALQDPQRIRLYVINAMNKEKTAFNMSGSKEEYFQLLAERIYQRRIGLEEQRKLMRTGTLRLSVHVTYVQCV